MWWINVVPLAHQMDEVIHVKLWVLIATLAVPFVALVLAVVAVNMKVTYRRQLNVQRMVYLLEVSVACFVITTIFSGSSNAGWWLFTTKMSDVDVFQTYFVALTVYQLMMYMWAKQRTSAEIDAYEGYLNWLNLYQLSDKQNVPLQEQLDEHLHKLEKQMLTNEVREMIKTVREQHGQEQLILFQQEQCRHEIALAELEWNQSILLRFLK